MRFAAAGVALLSLVGCSQEALLQKFTTPEDQATAKKYIDYLRAGQYEPIEKVMHPSIQGPTLHATLEKMAGMIPDEEPTSIKLVGAQSTTNSSGTTKNLIQLLSASVLYDAQGALILAASVPLGAILFLFRRRLPLRQDDET